MRVLGLDPATSTGWAFWSSEGMGGKPDFGVRIFRKKPHDHPGVRFSQYERFLHETINHYEPDVIYYECPLFPGKKTARHNLVISFGFEAVLWSVASQYERDTLDSGIPCVPVFPSTLKKWATGHGQAEKKDMIRAAKALTGVELTLKQDDEADALLLTVMGAYESGGTTP